MAEERKHQMVSVMDDVYEDPSPCLQIDDKKDDDVYNQYLRESSTNKKSHENIFSVKNPNKEKIPFSLLEAEEKDESSDEIAA